MNIFKECIFSQYYPGIIRNVQDTKNLTKIDVFLYGQMQK